MWDSTSAERNENFIKWNRDWFCCFIHEGVKTSVKGGVELVGSHTPAIGTLQIGRKDFGIDNSTGHKCKRQLSGNTNEQRALQLNAIKSIGSEKIRELKTSTDNS